MTTWLFRHSAPRFVAVGGVTFVADVGLLRLLHGALHVHLLPATAVAFMASALLNFGLNRQWAFSGGRTGQAHRQAGRYLALLLLNFALTLILVGGLAGLGMYYLLAKVFSTVVIAVLNFVVYRRWVFTS